VIDEIIVLVKGYGTEFTLPPSQQLFRMTDFRMLEQCLATFTNTLYKLVCRTRPCKFCKDGDDSQELFTSLTSKL